MSSQIDEATQLFVAELQFVDILSADAQIVEGVILGGLLIVDSSFSL